MSYQWLVDLTRGLRGRMPHADQVGRGLTFNSVKESGHSFYLFAFVSLIYLSLTSPFGFSTTLLTNFSALNADFCYLHFPGVFQL